MLSIYTASGSALRKSEPVDLAALPDEAVWIDMLTPTPAEDQAVEKLVGISIPTREEMAEIEISSRLYVENGGRYMTASLMCAADSPSPRITPVTFILANRRLHGRAGHAGQGRDVSDGEPAQAAIVDCSYRL